MKKALLTLVLCATVMGACYAQFIEGTIHQPTHVVGRRINAAGEITREFVSDFSYREDGKLQRYEFPEYALTAGYIYAGDFLTQENVSHHGGHPFFNETNVYTYENGQIKTVSHIMDQMGVSKYWVYSYYDDGRLERKDLSEEYDNDFRQHWLYEYENGSKTVIESYWTSWETQGLLLRKKTTSQYDDNYFLQSVQTENYAVSGELTSSTQTYYSYTPGGMVEAETTQILSEGDWGNSSIIQYAYDEDNRVTERLDGIWNADEEEWNYTRKITFELSEDGLTYTVSFYKRNNNGEWAWDVFNNQTVLFGPNLKIQQWNLFYLVNEEMNGEAKVNQLVFTLVETNEPTYVSTKENKDASSNVFPNPGSGSITVEAKTENAVIRFYDLQGRLVLAKMFDFQTNVSAEDWPSGMYLWEIWHDNQKAASGKWVKE